MRRDFGLFLRLYLCRLLIGLLTTTNSHPDEYWQSHEPAYKLVYGIGSPTYEWLIGMRSHVFLLPYIFGLALGRFIRSFELRLGQFAFLARSVDDLLVFNWRHFVAAFVAATVDLYTMRLACRLFPGEAIGRWTLLVSLTNATLLHTLSRTYSNCTETMLSLVALNLWPMKASDWSQRKFAFALLVIGWAALIRISVLQSWIFPGLAVLGFAPSLAIFSTLLPAVAGILAFGFIADRIGYGRWVFTGWNFVYWNQFRGLSAKFGAGLPYFYFKILATRTLSSLLPFLCIGLWEALKRTRSSKTPCLFPLTHLAVPTLACLSAISHKEVRFMAPIVPILLVYCAYGLQQAHVAVMKRSPWQRRLFWTALCTCIAWQLLCGHEQIRNRFCSHYKIFARLRDILDHDPHLDQSDRCNGGVTIVGLPYRLPGAGFLHRSAVFSSPSAHPEMIAPLLPKNELQEELSAFAVSRLFEPLLINMQVRGQPLPAILVLSDSFLKAPGAGTKILEASGYRECGFFPVEYPLEHRFWDTAKTLRHRLLDTKLDPEDVHVFCKRFNTTIFE